MGRLTWTLLFCLCICSTICFNVYQYPREYVDEEDGYYGDGYEWLDTGNVAVSKTVVKEAWTLKGNPASLVETKFNSVTNFIVDVEEETNELFGPPDYFIVGTTGSDSERHTNDYLSIEATGDAVYGNGNEDDGVFFLKINYDCFKAGTQQIGVSFTVVDISSKVTNVTFYWKKTCGSGVRDGFEVTVSELPDYDEESKSTVVSNGVTRSHWNFENPEHKLPLSKWAIEFLISIKEGFGSQAYSAPIVTCSDESILQIRAVGEAASSNIISEYDIQDRLKVIHTCKQTHGTVKVSAVISLGSFEPIKFSWLKSCEGGSLHGGFYISSEPQGEPNIVKDSNTMPEWSNATIKVPATENFSLFYLRSTTGPLSFSHPVVTVKPSHVLKASIAGDNMYGGLLGTDDSELRVDYKCLQKGNATVKVTVPFSEHQHPVEFTWIKECPKFVKKTKPVQSGYLTANRAMILFSFVVLVFGGLGAYTYFKHKKQRAAERRARLLQQQND